MLDFENLYKDYYTIMLTYGALKNNLNFPAFGNNKFLSITFLYFIYLYNFQ